MPPPATRRFSLYVLPPGADDPPERVSATLAALEQAGFVTSEGRPGRQPLVEGGFERLELVAGRRFVANGQGGFRVACPRTGESVIPSFHRAIAAWRQGGPREMACPCGEPHDLDALGYRPAAGFCESCVRIVEPERAELTPEAVDVLVASWGRAGARAGNGDPVRLVGRRG